MGRFSLQGFAAEWRTLSGKNKARRYAEPDFFSQKKCQYGFYSVTFNTALGTPHIQLTLQCITRALEIGCVGHLSCSAQLQMGSCAL